MGGGQREFRDKTTKNARQAAEEFLNQIATTKGPLQVEIQEGSDPAAFTITTYGTASHPAPADPPTPRSTKTTPAAAEPDSAAQDDAEPVDRLAQLRGRTARGKRHVVGASAALTERLGPAREAIARDRRLMAAAILAGVVVLALVGVLLKALFSGGGSDAAASAPSSDTTIDGCYGGPNAPAAALAARSLATSDTVDQNGVTVPGPAGAEAAAATFARLRSNFAVPGNATSSQLKTVFASRDAAYRQILAPDATAAAKQLVGATAARGYNVHLDMTRARAKLITGNGQAAGIDLLLTTVGKGPRNPKQPTKNITAVGPTQVAVHLDLKVIDGQWRLQNVTAPATDSTTLAQSGVAFSNTEECSK